jgi:hypothetical protein
MVKTIEILPFVEGAAPQHWWQWGLVIVIVASGGIGLLVVLCYLAKSLWKVLHVRSLAIVRPLLTLFRNHGMAPTSRRSSGGYWISI